MGNPNDLINCQNAKYKTTANLSFPETVQTPDGKSYILKEISTCAFCVDNTIENIFISKTIQKIRAWAFDKCRNLQTITFDNQSELGILESGSFARLPSIQSLIIPQSVYMIEKNAIGSSLIQRIHYCGKNYLDFTSATTELNEAPTSPSYDFTRIYLLFNNHYLKSTPRIKFCYLSVCPFDFDIKGIIPTPCICSRYLTFQTYYLYVFILL